MARLKVLVWLKWRLWWNGFRVGAKAVDTAVAAIITFLGAVVSCGLAFGLSAVVHLGLRDGDPDAADIGLQVFFWVLAFLAVILPVVFGMGQSTLPLARLTSYPLSRRALYGLSIAASGFSANHLFWLPILVAVSATVLILDKVPAGPWCLGIVVFVSLLIVWCHTAILMVQRVMRRRSVRELAALIGLVVVVTVSLVPAIFEAQIKEGGASALRLPLRLEAVAKTVASVFPSTIAAGGITRSISGDQLGFATSLLWLSLWTIVGVVLGYRLLSGALFDGVSSSGGKSLVPRRSHKPSAPVLDMDVFQRIPDQVRAIAAKELHYLMRSTTGKFNIAIMPVFVIVMALVVTRDLTGPVFGIDQKSLVFVGAMVYASMFSNNFLFNSYAWERAGIRSYFVCPVSAEQVVVGKNLGVWIYNLILAVLCALIFCVVAGIPSIGVVASGVLAFAASLLTFTVAGNFVSPSLPVARDIAKISNSSSQTGVLLSFAILVVNLILIGVPVAVTSLMDVAWAQPFVLMALVVAEVGIYRLMLPAAARLVEERREPLVEAATATL